MTRPEQSFRLAGQAGPVQRNGSVRDSVVFPVVQGKDGWRAERRGPVIFATFKGSLRGSDGSDSARWCIGLLGDDDVCLVFDLFGLERYESRVRTDWQTLTSPHAAQFACIYAGATDPLVRMGLTTFGLTTGIATQVFGSRRALERALAAEAG